MSNLFDCKFKRCQILVLISSDQSSNFIGVHFYTVWNIGSFARRGRRGRKTEELPWSTLYIDAGESTRTSKPVGEWMWNQVRKTCFWCHIAAMWAKNNCMTGIAWNKNKKGAVVVCLFVVVFVLFCFFSKVTQIFM